MKRNLKFITSASAASLLVFSSLAQETPDAKSGGTEIVPERSGTAMRAMRLGRVVKASDLIGMEVKNDEGEKLGKVDDLAVDLETGRIVQVILSTGGFLGLSVMLVPVPPGALHHEVANKFIHLKADQAKLKAAPWYGMSKRADLGQSNQVVEIYRYHGQQPYFAAAFQSTWGPDPTARLSYVQSTTKLKGVSVKNAQKETLGKVENLMVDLSAGRVVAVILSSGRLFGMGEVLCAVPSAAFRFNSEQKYLQLDASKEAMSKAPHFNVNEWPSLGDPSYVGGVYRAYRVEPYFTVETTETANTVRNDPISTQVGQGNTKADVATTAQIRKEIGAEKGMSLNARNVKVTTNKGQVTLRGPVNTAEEKRLIGEIADRIARSENVDNQLEVKLTTSSNK
jgi:sporulation protein YlmC with PRC-barrel domain